MNAILNSIPASIRAMLAIVLGARAGAFIGFLWERPVKTRKGVSGIVTKRVRTVARCGINHDNRAAVQEARANGDAPAVNAGLPWGEWLMFPYFIGHKGGTYLRLEPAINTRPMRVEYFHNGKRITRNDAMELCLASEFREASDFGCFTLNVANLKRVKLTKAVA